MAVALALQCGVSRTLRSTALARLDIRAHGCLTLSLRWVLDERASDGPSEDHTDAERTRSPNLASKSLTCAVAEYG
jgi:hypothetical protein